MLLLPAAARLRFCGFGEVDPVAAVVVVVDGVDVDVVVVVVVVDVLNDVAVVADAAFATLRLGRVGLAAPGGIFSIARNTSSSSSVSTGSRSRSSPRNSTLG